MNSVGEEEQRLLCQECIWLQVAEQPPLSTLQAMGFLRVVMLLLGSSVGRAVLSQAFCGVSLKAGRGVRLSTSVQASISHQIHVGHLGKAFACSLPPPLKAKYLLVEGGHRCP